jgi:hypothetical protein
MSQIKNSLVSRHAPYWVYIIIKKEYNKTKFSIKKIFKCEYYLLLFTALVLN